MEKYLFSIVIAVAPERSLEVLSSIKELSYPKEKYEIIVERGLNPSDNRNRGAKKSRGKFIAFIDDDAVVEKNFLKNAEEFLEENENIDIVGGPQLTPLDDSRFAKISGYAFSSIFGAWKISNRYSGKDICLNADETMLTSANLFCRKKVFKKVNFNPKLFPGEDPDFISKAKKQGFNIAYSPKLIVYHRRRNSFYGLANQIYKYGKTRPEKESLRETLKMPFFLVPSAFLLYIFFLALLSLDSITGAVIGAREISWFSFYLMLPLLTYVILSLSFSLASAIIEKDIFAFFILPLVYLTIHLSYGAGFLFSSLRLSFRKIKIKRNKQNEKDTAD